MRQIKVNSLLGNEIITAADVKSYVRIDTDEDDAIITNMITQARFYLFGIFKGEAHPFAINKERKFNPLQKIAYVAVMYVCMPLVIISGLGLMFPETIIMQVFGVSGMVLTDLLHLVMAFCLSIFLLIHLYLCTLGDKPGTLFKSMITGYHEEH